MESKIFNRGDIKAGYLLVVKDTGTGEQYNMTVLPSLSNAEPGNMGCCCPGINWWPLSEFSEHTLVYGEHKIIEIYDHTSNMRLLDNSTENRKLLWARPAEVKKMTVKEICEALGYDVEIVK